MTSRAQVINNDRIHAHDFVCRFPGHSSAIVHAGAGALSRWQLVGRDLHATLNVAAVPDAHWAATGFRAAPDVASLAVTIKADDNDHEAFDAAVALTPAAA
jgi:hypothetical protein